MLLILQNIAGFVYAHWRLFVYGLFALVVVIAVIVLFRSCGKTTPKLDQAEILKAQQAIANQDRKVMIDILANSNAREAATDQTVDNAKAAANDAATQARKDAANMSNEELAAELERRAKE